MPQFTRNQIIIVVLVLLIICAAVILGVLILTGLFVVIRTETSEIPAITSVEFEPTPTPALENSWLRIVEAGEIIVGTAADYPPFAFYTQDFIVDGFDVALIREIGDILGVKVTIRDMAFDGLTGAIQIGQIDAAIAAISVTQERDLVLDFSNVYFVSEDGIIARQDADINKITSVRQISDYRVGVQEGSVYEDWLRSELVDSERMSENNFQVFQLMDQALDALDQGQIDLIVLDYFPAEEFAKSDRFKLVGRSLNRQRYAIAVENGATSLLNEINRALSVLQEDGVVSELVEKYIGIEGGIVATPEPEETPQGPLPTQPSPACVDGMAFVADLTLPDNNMTDPPVIPPGNPFRKGWRIRNTGTCLWDSTYILTYAGGNSPVSQMRGAPTPITGQIQPGGLADIFIDMVAPLAPGIYQGFWELESGMGASFGERLSVGITVPLQPAPTQTPVMDIFFVAQPTNIDSGERVVFNWRVSNPRAVFFYEQGEPWQQNPVPPVGGREVYPPTTSVFELRVVRQDDSVEIRQIIIFVNQVSGAPLIREFSISPGGIVPVNTCVEIFWIVEGEVRIVNILRDGGFIWNGAPLSGSIESCLKEPGEVVFSIDARGPGGSSSQARTVDTIE